MVVLHSEVSIVVITFGSDVDETSRVETTRCHDQQVVLPAQEELESNFAVSKFQTDKVTLKNKRRIK